MLILQFFSISCCRSSPVISQQPAIQTYDFIADSVLIIADRVVCLVLSGLCVVCAVSIDDRNCSELSRQSKSDYLLHIP